MKLAFARPSLRHVLPLLFLIMAAIPTGAIGVLLTERAWERELEAVREQHLQLAENLAGALSRYAQDIEAAFSLVAVNLSDDRVVPELTTLLDRLDFKHVCLVYPDGRVQRFLSPDANLVVERIDPGVLDELERDPSSRPIAMTGVLPDRTGAPTIYVGKQMPSGNWVVGGLRTDYFARLQASIRFGQEGHAAIVDRHGQVIAHPNPSWRASMQNISAVDPVRRMMAGETGVSRFFSPAKHEDMIAGFTTTPETGWGVMIPQPISELEARVGEVERAVWTVVALALLAAAGLGWFFSRWLTAPLARIGQAAERFAQGDYGARAGASHRLQTKEAEILSARFDAMADNVTRSTEAFRKSEDRFRDFATIAADCLWETDLDQTYTYVSPPPQHGGEWVRQLRVGQSRRRNLAPAGAGADALERIQHHMDEGAPFNDIVYEIDVGTEQPVTLAVCGRPMCNAAGRVVGYRGVTRDISARLAAEAQLKQAERDEQQRETHKMEAIGTLAGGIAHDFNNILNVILGFTELTLDERKGDALVRENLRHVHEAGERARSLVQQILTFSRKGKQERQPLHLERLVEEALPLLRASLPTTIDIVQRLDVGQRRLMEGDATQIHQVLMNLVTNAAHAINGEGGRIEISVECGAPVGPLPRAGLPRPDDWVCLTVRDSGHGMSAEVRERVFEPFFSTKDINEGTGMGLAVVHGIVANHGGTIQVESTPEAGSTFRVYFPVIDAPFEVPAAPRRAADQVNGKGRVLFVDDEIALVRLAEATLTTLGYEATATPSSLDALARFERAPHAFDLVIADQTMPELTGDGLIRKMREVRPDLPAILCTGFSHAFDAESAQAQGIDAFCLKPVLGRELGATIQSVLRQRRRNEHPLPEA